jgi:hypothetical protein
MLQNVIVNTRGIENKGGVFLGRGIKIINFRIFRFSLLLSLGF